jgi:hypothetical protein
MNAAIHHAPWRGFFQACLIVAALLTAGSVSGACSASHSSAGQPAAAPVTMAPDAAVLAAAWAARPAYTDVSERTAEAYHYALGHPTVIRWMPCYCGCGAMGHGSNLDCYFEPRADGSLVFEEHASYCTICVDITLRTKQLVAAGTSLAEIRAVIDAEFGGRVPGTDTPFPV